MVQQFMSVNSASIVLNCILTYLHRITPINASEFSARWMIDLHAQP